MDDLSALADLPDVTPMAAGKVRERWAVGSDKILLVATDRISAFDVVLPTPIPDKGKVLTAMTAFWTELLADVVPNHIISTKPSEYGHGLEQFSGVLSGRSMLCHRAKPLPVECVARGYLAGSGWREYRESGELCGIRPAPGMVQSEQFEVPIFTPATKAAAGEHDENISFDKTVELLGRDLAVKVREVTLGLYQKAATHALSRGLIVADTKFEFGLYGDEVPPESNLMLIDEVLTPDSSRFWDVEQYEPGLPQPAFDKQYVRDWLETQPWDKTAPGPELPVGVVSHTRANYIEAYERLTGSSFDDWLTRDQ